ncbi:S41 family peptidase [Leeuwenhoekiella sp. NPDC079379]|uniref:S41 family peptidase n=1 Tax=Leeuwenhoekiella sp. NPDC079379 TaxID=3364122 RepID=UPI0037C53D18
MNAQETISETEKLASFAKIYGFLKYYHPEVANGTFNWDQQFIDQLPKVLNATSNESLSKIYIDWIEILGEIKNCQKCDSKGIYFDENFDLSWINDTINFNKSLSLKLEYIEKNRIQVDQFYVEIQPVGNIKVTNEPEYKNFEYPGEEYRLLGLFKYWNIIEYFYPYKYLTDQNWDSVLKEMIPKIRSASNKKEYHLVLQELIAKLDDTHASITFSEEKSKYLPIKISHIDNKAVVSGFYNDSLAKLNNLQLGDVILKLNDIDIKNEAQKNLKYVAGSNSNIKFKLAYIKIFKGLEDTISLTINRNNSVRTIKSKRYDFDDFNYRSNPKSIKSKSISDAIGYINMANVKEDDIKDIFKSFKNKTALIIDLRNYPSFIYYKFSEYLNQEKKHFATYYCPDINYPSRFVKTNLRTNDSKKAFVGKIIVLVNEGSLSLSEFTTMAFQTADNVVTVGNQTAGADGDVVKFDYLGGFKTTMSGNGVLYPDGTLSQRDGVKIDVIVKPTLEGLRQGRDEILEKAIEIANE